MATFIEQDCTIVHEGKSFTAGGAYVTPERALGYVGKVIPNSGRRELTDWHGNVIGTCFISSTWRTPRSYVSSTMSQIYARIDGIDYTGRGAGEGMSVNLKRCRS